MRVGFFQFTPRFGEVSNNLDKVVETLDRADADLIVLPELFASGYQFVSQQEAITLSESVPDGPTTQRLIDLAKRRRMVIVAGLAERAGTACYNSAVVVGPSGFIGCYRKTHLFFEETLFFYARRYGISGVGYRASQDRRNDLFQRMVAVRRRLVRWRSRGQRSSAIPRTWCCPIALTPCRFGAWKIECSRLRVIARGAKREAAKIN